MCDAMCDAMCVIGMVHSSGLNVITCVCPQGREDGALIEDWEDPDLSIYKSTDRYGFMQ